jgi:hypothetical protein
LGSRPQFRACVVRHLEQFHGLPARSARTPHRLLELTLPFADHHRHEVGMHHVLPSPVFSLRFLAGRSAGPFTRTVTRSGRRVTHDLKKLLPADLLAEPEQHRLALHALSVGSMPRRSST